MAAQPITMNQIRLVLQCMEKGFSKRSMTRQTGISRNTLRRYIKLLDNSGYTIEELKAFSNEQLAEICYQKADISSTNDQQDDFLCQLPYYVEELKKAHVTRQILWEEYREQYPEGYGYTRFCYYLNQYIAKKEVSAHFEYYPGEKLQLDFAGDTLHYIDAQSGEQIECQVFVAILPYSSYTYVEALPNQQQASFLKALNNTFKHIGGVPQCVICDNMKTMVKKADRYEPTFTELGEQISLHYNTSIMATRPRKPKDKAPAESAVNHVYKRIYAALRKKSFFSLKELNIAIKEQLVAYNNRKFKNKDNNRLYVFETYEQPTLLALPADILEIKKTVFSKVQKNYHITLGEDMHLYSVPYRYIGQRVKAIYDSSVVEVYADNQRIATHNRNYKRHSYSTLKEHMPDNHKAVYAQKGWDSEYFTRQAHQIGPYSGKYITKLLESKSFPEQTYNACLGVLRLAKRYGDQRLEAVCKLAYDAPRANYTLIKTMLENKVDQIAGSQQTIDYKTPSHDNIRGPENYY